MAISALVGRERPSSVLRSAVAGACDGHGGLVLIAGEAGIGKTALVADAAEEARRRGALLLGGTCWDGEGAPGYWPWVQVVRAFQRAASADEWVAARDAAGGGLAFLLGELTGAGPTIPAEDKGFALYDSVTKLIVTASLLRPVVIIIDDLHWADPASIKLLDFFVRHGSLNKVLVLGTYRDVEVEADDHPLRSLLRALTSRATTLTLTGLDSEAVAALIRQISGEDAAPELVAEVHHRTGGNPFFVEQTARLWHAGGATRSALTPGIRDVLDRRLAHLPAITVALLTAAAFLGAEFDAETVAASCGLRLVDVEQGLDKAVTGRLISAWDNGRFVFVHDLVRETLYGSIGADESRRRHAAIIRAIEDTPTLGARMHPAQRARHAYLAVPEIEPGKAAGFVLAAALDASARLAAEEASGHYGRALELIAEDRLHERLEVTLALATQLHCAGELVNARRTFGDAASIARTVGDVEALAHSALGLHALGYTMESDYSGIAVVDEAYEALVGSGMGGDRVSRTPLAARLLAAASRERAHHIGQDREYAKELSSRAVALARGCRDDAALGFCLLARHDAVWEPGTARERSALADEMTAAAHRCDDLDMELQAALLKMVALLERGDPRGLDELVALGALAERTGLPRHRYVSLSRQGTIATLSGRFAEGRTLIDEALSLGERLGEVDARSVWGDQLWELARMQGQFDEVDLLIKELRVAGDPHVIVLDACVALDKGEPELAIRHQSELEALGAVWPRWATLTWMTVRAQLAAATNDAALCATVRSELIPYFDQWAVLAGAVVIHGPIAFFAGLLDSVLQRWDDAIEGLEKAWRSADRLGARPWSILARFHLAEARLGRAAAGDLQSASEHLLAVEAEAAEIGMVSLIDRARRLHSRALLFADAAAPAAPPVDNVFHFDGEVWTLTFAGRTTLLPDAKGLADIHVLLSRPGSEVSAIGLLSHEGSALVAAFRRVGADAVLDDEAKARYRRRLVEIDEQIDRAVSRHDDDRAARLDHERAALIEELRSASGLGGRPRGLGDEAEKARKAVTARKRDVLRKLESRHSELANHLQRTLSTGTMCRYQPEDDTGWTL